MLKILSKYRASFTAVKSSKGSAVVALAVKSCIIGFAYVVLKLGTSYASAVDILFDRLILAFGVFYLSKSFGLFKVEPIKGKLRIHLVILSLLYPIGFFLFETYGIELITASESAIILALVPIFTLIFFVSINKRKDHMDSKTGALLSILGIVYITVQSVSRLSSSIVGYGLTFLALLFIVFYYIYLKKISVELSSRSMTYYLLKYATLFIIPFYILYSLLGDNHAGLFERFSMHSYLWIILYLGVLSTLGTSFLTNYSIKRVSASQVAIFANLSPMIGVLAGILILNDPWEIEHVIGGILVFVGIYMSLNFNSNQ